MKFYLLCQGLTTDEIDKLTKGFDCSQLGAVVAEDVNLPLEFKSSFSFDLYESIEKLLEKVNPELICIIGMSGKQFELVSSLLESGVSVSLAAPLRFSKEQIRNLSSLAEQSNSRFYINFSELFRGANSRLLEWANHLDNPPANDRINVSIILNNQISRFRSYLGPNTPHWCYELPCGVFHQELEKCLNLIQPVVGKVNNIAVSESSHGYLPQNISDELVIELQGSQLNATINIKICEQNSSREIQLSSDGGEIRFGKNETDGYMLDSGNGEKNIQGQIRGLSRKLRGLFKFPLKTLSHSSDIGELEFIHNIASNFPANSINIERYSFIHGALMAIAGQLRNIHLNFDNFIKTGEETQNCKRVLITGASGLFGKRLSAYLNDKGYIVRAFIRKLSDYSYFQNQGIEYCYGDITDAESLKQAFTGVDYVVHAAADTSGDLKTGELSTIQGTRNILELCNQFEIERLVYISSCNVYDIAHLQDNAEIDESSLLEQFPERRGGYTFTKLKADLLVQDTISANRGSITCLRPGTYISKYGPFMSPMIGVSLLSKYFLVFGRGNLILPLVFIENLCSATELSLTSTRAKGETFNVIDGLSMSKKEFREKVLRKIYSNARFIFIPYKLLYFIIFLQEILLNFLGRKPYLTRYRFESSQKEVRYNSNKIEELLDWSPPISADEAIKRILAEQKRSSTGDFHS